MAASYTQHYGLPLWGAEDTPKRKEVNAAAEKIDENFAALTALVPKLAVGHYAGTGSYGSGKTSTLSLEFRPELILIFNPADATRQAICLPGFGGNAQAFGANFYPVFVTWSDSTVSWYSVNSAQEQFNDTGTVYTFLAV